MPSGYGCHPFVDPFRRTAPFIAPFIVPPKELPHTLKLITVWLLVTLVVFLGFKAWERQRESDRFRQAGDTVVLSRSPDGHFHWPGQVNGHRVDFLVDTGATSTALPQALAEQAGLKPIGQVHAQTAGGTTRGYIARIDLELAGGVRAERLQVTVLPELAGPLLGMDVLSRLQFSQQGGELRIAGGGQ